jgi:hypothetical protein
MTNRLPREAALATVVRTVTPYLGQTMAQAAVEMHRQKLGIEGAHITAEMLETLVQRISMGLIIFVGRDKADLIVREVHEAVGALGAAQ